MRPPTTGLALRPARTLRLLAACGVAGPALFTLAWIVLGLLRPGYDPVAQFISELAERGAPGAPPMIAAFLALGARTLAFSVGLHRGIAGGRGAPLGPALVAVFGACTIGSGLFRCDPGCGGASLSNTLHTAITHAGLGALVLATLLLPFRLARDGRWRDLRPYSWLTGLVATAIFASGFERFGGAGLGQRLFIGLLFLWLAVMAARLLRLARQAPA